MRESARARVVGARAWWVRARKRAKTHLFTHLALDTPRTRHTMETFPCGGRLGGSDQHSERDVVRIRRDGLPREQPFALTLLREFTCLPPMRRKRLFSIFLYTRTHSICLCNLRARMYMPGANVPDTGTALVSPPCSTLSCVAPIGP